MSEDFNDFRRRVLKINGKRNHNITNSMGVRDAYRWCRKNKVFKDKAVSTKDFYGIVRTVNNLFAEELKQGRDVRFPQRMGQLEVRKYNTYVKFVDGKVHTNRGVNWKATLELWNKDEEARESKLLIRSEDKKAFSIFYNRHVGEFNNKYIIQFKPNRALLCELNNLAKEGMLDAYKISL